MIFSFNKGIPFFIIVVFSFFQLSIVPQAVNAFGGDNKGGDKGDATPSDSSGWGGVVDSSGGFGGYDGSAGNYSAEAGGRSNGFSGGGLGGDNSKGSGSVGGRSYDSKDAVTKSRGNGTKRDERSFGRLSGGNNKGEKTSKEHSAISRAFSSIYDGIRSIAQSVIDAPSKSVRTIGSFIGVIPAENNQVFSDLSEVYSRQPSDKHKNINDSKRGYQAVPDNPDVFDIEVSQERIQDDGSTDPRGVFVVDSQETPIDPISKEDIQVTVTVEDSQGAVLATSDGTQDITLTKEQAKDAIVRVSYSCDSCETALPYNNIANAGKISGSYSVDIEGGKTIVGVAAQDEHKNQAAKYMEVVIEGVTESPSGLSQSAKELEKRDTRVVQRSVKSYPAVTPDDTSDTFDLDDISGMLDRLEVENRADKESAENTASEETQQTTSYRQVEHFLDDDANLVTPDQVTIVDPVPPPPPTSDASIPEGVRVGVEHIGTVRQSLSYSDEIDRVGGIDALSLVERNIDEEITGLSEVLDNPNIDKNSPAYAAAQKAHDELIDARNAILSMSDKEYAEIPSYYTESQRQRALDGLRLTEEAYSVNTATYNEQLDKAKQNITIAFQAQNILSGGTLTVRDTKNRTLSPSEIIQAGNALLDRVTVDGKIDENALIQELTENPEMLSYIQSRTVVETLDDGNDYYITEITIGDKALVGSRNLAATLADLTGRSLPTQSQADAIIAQSTGGYIRQDVPTSDDVEVSSLVTVGCVSDCDTLTAGTERKTFITDDSGRVAIYGGRYTESSELVQPVYSQHGATYADYSQGITLISRVDDTDVVGLTHTTTETTYTAEDLVDMSTDEVYGLLVQAAADTPEEVDKELDALVHESNDLMVVQNTDQIDSQPSALNRAIDKAIDFVNTAIVDKIFSSNTGLEIDAEDVTADLIEFIKGQERFSSEAFWDYGQMSIGYGTRARDGETVITEEEAVERLKEEVAIAAAVVDEQVTVPLTNNQRDALISFVYNVGPKAFEDSALLSKLNQGDYTSVESEMGRWVHVTDSNGNKNVLPGLVTRRAEEAALFNTEDKGIASRAVTGIQSTIGAVASGLRDMFNLDKSVGNQDVLQETFAVKQDVDAEIERAQAAVEEAKQSVQGSAIDSYRMGTYANAVSRLNDLMRMRESLDMIDPTDTEAVKEAAATVARQAQETEVVADFVRDRSKVIDGRMVTLDTSAGSIQDESLFSALKDQMPTYTYLHSRTSPGRSAPERNIVLPDGTEITIVEAMQLAVALYNENNPDLPQITRLEGMSETRPDGIGSPRHEGRDINGISGAIDTNFFFSDGSRMTWDSSNSDIIKAFSREARKMGLNIEYGGGYMQNATVHIDLFDADSPYDRARNPGGSNGYSSGGSTFQRETESLAPESYINDDGDFVITAFYTDSFNPTSGYSSIEYVVNTLIDQELGSVNAGDTEPLAPVNTGRTYAGGGSDRTAELGRTSSGDADRFDRDEPTRSASRPSVRDDTEYVVRGRSDTVASVETLPTVLVDIVTDEITVLPPVTEAVLVVEDSTNKTNNVTESTQNSVAQTTPQVHDSTPVPVVYEIAGVDDQIVAPSVPDRVQNNASEESTPEYVAVARAIQETDGAIVVADSQTPSEGLIGRLFGSRSANKTFTIDDVESVTYSRVSKRDDPYNGTLAYTIAQKDGRVTEVEIPEVTTIKNAQKIFNGVGYTSDVVDVLAQGEYVEEKGFFAKMIDKVKSIFTESTEAETVFTDLNEVQNR